MSLLREVMHLWTLSISLPKMLSMLLCATKHHQYISWHSKDRYLFSLKNKSLCSVLVSLFSLSLCDLVRLCSSVVVEGTISYCVLPCSLLTNLVLSMLIIRLLRNYLNWLGNYSDLSFLVWPLNNVLPPSIKGSSNLFFQSSHWGLFKS